MPRLERRSISEVPIEVIQRGIRMSASNLSRNGLLPNGLQQLVYGSLIVRREVQFFMTGANQGHYLNRGDQNELQRLWEAWIDQYDGYSGDNLAATALYQHDRYVKDDPRFPRPETEQYAQLVQQMGRLGNLVREFAYRHKNDWSVINPMLHQIDRPPIK